MTVRELYRNVLIELNKEEASSLYVEDFLYFANKAVNWYVNMRYNLYDTSQQLGDDLRALKEGPEVIDVTSIDNLSDLNFEYRHLLNCIVGVNLKKYSIKCEQKPNTIVEYAAKRMTSDRRAAILNNAFLKAEFFRPYFDIKGSTLEVLTGEVDDAKYAITQVTIEYLRNPKVLTLDQSDLVISEDKTDELEFPEYVNIEIVNATTKFIMEQGSDQRLNTNPAVNQSIGPFGGEN